MITNSCVVFGTWCFTFGMFFAFAGDWPWFARCMSVAFACSVEIEARCGS